MVSQPKLPELKELDDLEKQILDDFNTLQLLWTWMQKSRDANMTTKMKSRFGEVYPRLCFYLALKDLQGAPPAWTNNLLFIAWLEDKK